MGYLSFSTRPPRRRRRVGTRSSEACEDRNMTKPDGSSRSCELRLDSFNRLDPTSDEHCSLLEAISHTDTGSYSLDHIDQGL